MTATLPPCMDTPDNAGRDEDRKFALLAEMPLRDARAWFNTWRSSRRYPLDPVAEDMMRHALAEREAMEVGR